MYNVHVCAIYKCRHFVFELLTNLIQYLNSIRYLEGKIYEKKTIIKPKCLHIFMLLHVYSFNVIDIQTLIDIYVYLLTSCIVKR